MKLSIERKLKLLEEDENIRTCEYYTFHFSDVDLELEMCRRKNFYKYFCGHAVKQNEVIYILRDSFNCFLKEK